MIITKHAIERYIQRIENNHISIIEAKQLINATYEASEQLEAYTQVSRHVQNTDEKVIEYVEIRLYGNMIMVVITRYDKKMIVTCYDYKGSIHDKSKALTV